MSHDLAVARAATMKPIAAVAETAGIPADALEPHGKHIAKLDADYLASLKDRPDGRLILVTAINPTPAGEGKTTTTIGLGDGLNRIGKRTVIALREPSLGPVFGTKGGATGGGKAQVLPMEAINLHFTGDFHAITAAHNLLAALVDNHVYWGNSLGIDTRKIVWRRVMDMNDRALRAITNGLGGGGNGFAREDGFDITVASEVMACFCLARDLDDLEERLSRIVVAYTRAKKPITAGDLNAAGAMAVLLKDAIRPNLVQTIEGSPALIHGGPFANIAHGCNSVIATRAAMKLGDYVVTEAGFGADLGAEKFFDIKCRKAGLKPDAAVVVATVRALKMNGGVAKIDLARENLDALRAGIVNLGRHVENVRAFGLPVVVAINHFTTDTAAEHQLIADICRDEFGVEAVQCSHWADGAAGAEELARKVVELCEGGTAHFQPIYPDHMPLAGKILTIATRIYRAAEIAIAPKAAADLAAFEAAGFGDLPVCMAKTQYSFSADPTLLGAPSGHIVPVREVRLAAGAGFVVAICGEIMTMPGLPKLPAAEGIHLNDQGQIEGLF
ncbi:MAG: formate--tetrahydrofolate ligase [Proteobacteria bacterium]|nr:formate--tetrahydrofolate ligase [Pseudomonadota bacterium]